MAASDKDQGTGDPDMFRVSELETQYRLGGPDKTERILGAELNALSKTNTYIPHEWYRVTDKGVELMSPNTPTTPTKSTPSSPTTKTTPPTSSRPPIKK